MNTYEDLMRVTSLSATDTSEALDHLAKLIDLSDELGEAEGLERALSLGQELGQRDLTTDQVPLLHYFLANALSDIQYLRRRGKPAVWEWEQEEAEKAIFHLRSALRAEGFLGLHKIRQCQILTNLGNIFNHIGRCVEAIEYWDGALAINSKFGMARGNRGYGIIHYASLFEHLCHQVPFLKHAYSDLKAALALELEGGAEQGFREALNWIESRSPSGRIEETEEKSHAVSLGSTKGEVRYRTWCLENRLFLNPMNDLGTDGAAKDILTTPSIVVPINDGMAHFGFFNQLKQEFVSARYFYYEGISADRPHYSDKQVILYNTFDYPSYSLAVEKVKASFRILYSVFDKIAFFLNNYMSLSIPERRISFRSFWYKSQDKGKGLRDDLRQRENWPLRGLFWLSKDLYEDQSGFRDVIEPDAQELAAVRNHLEHKYLKLHEFGPPPRFEEDDDEDFAPAADSLAYSVGRSEFEAKTLKLMKIVRAALIYLSLAIYTEEKSRARERGDADMLPSMPADIWSDEFKI
jgi:hypothetical protein